MTKTKKETPKTFAHQAALPHFPVPSVEETLERYVESVKPFLTKDELQKTEALAKDYGKPGGEAERLQKVLLKRAEEHENWLEEWWEYAAYLSDRTPIAPYISMVSGFGSFLDFERPVPQARRAAETIRYTCEYLELLKQEMIPPETMGGRTLCMNMFRRLFSTCRVPGSPVDHFERVDPNGIRHIIVLCAGRIFVLPVYNDADELLTIGDLEAQLLRILDHSKYLNALKPESLLSEHDGARFIGALTSLNRDEWAQARSELLEFDGYNKDNLEKIQRSLFAICLEDSSPTNPSDLVKASSAANCGNRWYDKSFQYVIFQNGMVGANMEHANADATILQSMFRWLGERYLNRKGGIETLIESRHHSLAFLPSPELLKWKLPESVKAKIPQAVDSFNKTAPSLRTLIIRNKKFGKDVLKQVRLFPDTFVQMAIQLAGFKLWGEVVPTYESAHTRMFVNGRTETIRTVSNEVKDWLEAVHSRQPENVVYEKLQTAMRKHKELTMAALTGSGVDRHLLGLQVAAYMAGKQPHQLYSDAAYVKSGGGGNFVLSTSNVSGYPWLWGGFVPMVPHGIGVCYGSEADFLTFMITSFDANPLDRQVPNPRPRFSVETFQKALWSSFDEIFDLVKKYQKQQAKM
ncbi:hypothetical protein Poli38472_007612 [Pythium oligandrum]|uniref:Choline/carnitine acyltransferase domain-containing protein n=1 Tax=Pythium oligandrum TaxID=41045 RepID=A0A8K1CSJ3_PYTOL|nr:hypothetical protein Poli38472_007612 [Pythium oligandrum]|eukprot:TMW67940.1 hypothetical protein Poli38472_007612 [Pythium oligandrum]